MKGFPGVAVAAIAAAAGRPGWLHLHPDHALVLFTLGVLLIYVELNRPGWVAPGSVGLLCVLFAVAALLQTELNPAAGVLMLTGVALLALGLMRRTNVVVAVAATIALVLGFDRLVAGPGRLHLHATTAGVCGVVLGAGTFVLTRIARRARTNKALD